MNEEMQAEMLAKLQKAESAEEIVSIAKEYGQEITEEKAKELLDRLNGPEGDLADDALEAVTGGGFKDWLKGIFGESPGELPL